MNRKEMDALAASQARAAFSREIDLIDEALHWASVGASSSSTGGNHDRGAGVLSILLLNRAVNSLTRALKDSVEGYYPQAWMLCRGALEDWGTIRYVLKNPSDAGIWLREVVPEMKAETRWPPKFETIWASLEPEIVAPIKNLYGTLSAGGAHPRAEGLAFQFDEGPSGIVIRNGGVFHLADCRASLNHMLLLASICLDTSRIIQDFLTGQVKDEWKTPADRFMADLSEALLGQKKASL